ncbi:uncharacterized protein TRIADDRAFT_58550 [Trichoplax adhaerens]|uniref:DDE Tnp4 domain-containing protein n=1 Tax=Trichoplax adhaerens TaxID=10228 RepID=B3S305_TRIAD|nr:hypothetical protein TRIADDRAFT_58550 [Trichoplax adhaerens]EDV22882.1 hypothetical protein TRIADDRAFT_58550 [Trichoplax adhaerens]|eukprot:XP_002114748.1 hypothetical protein TRIADDRAFT_58550 [Trichoplax adhaerens]
MDDCNKQEVATEKEESQWVSTELEMLTKFKEETLQLREMLQEKSYNNFQFDIDPEADLTTLPLKLDCEVYNEATKATQLIIEENLKLKETVLAAYLKIKPIMYHDSQEEDDENYESQSSVIKVNKQIEAITNACYQLFYEIERLQKENTMASNQLKRLQITPETFQEEKKVEYYTGLPGYNMMMIIYRYTIANVTYHGNNSLTSFQKFILVLMKLRLNLSGEDLAYRFGVKAATSARIVSEMLNTFYIKLKPLIIWPNKDQRTRTMPIRFKQYFGSDIVVIIDCFEIFIERPSNLLARAKTWSPYKMHNTIKYLIGVTPQGTISFISQGWGGRVSDKHITENCGILDQLSPGDIILADRRFNIAESVSSKGALLITPNSAKGNNQLPAFDIERARKIAHITIQVERIIDFIRLKYKILQSTLKLSTFQDHKEMLSIDKIVTVCCALFNLCPCIVPIN